MGAGERKLGVGMIKKCRLPGIGGMALGAIGAEIILYMIRIAHSGIIPLVAGVTVCRGVVVTVGVAGDAIQGNVGAGKREIGGSMIEHCRRPFRGVVTLGAILAEIICCMVGVQGVGIIIFMAGNTLRRKPGKYIVLMTIAAIHCLMRAGKGKVGQIVIKVCRFPGNVAMANLAIRWEITANMVGIVDFIIVRLMTAETIPGQAGKLIIGMTITACNCGMCPVQFKTGFLKVVERRALPSLFAMAGFTVLRKAEFGMCRGGGILVFRQVAVDTLLSGSGIGVHMAAIAISLKMSAPQLEHLRMGVFRSLPFPRRGSMAAHAVQSKARLTMRRIFRLHKAGYMASAAFRRGAGIFGLLFPHMAGLAVCYGMHPGKRKAPGGMQFKIFLLIFPTVVAVAGLTVAAKLGAVHIGMAIGTCSANLGKFQTLMTGNTIGKLVST